MRDPPQPQRLARPSQLPLKPAHDAMKRHAWVEALEHFGAADAAGQLSAHDLREYVTWHVDVLLIQVPLIAVAIYFLIRSHYS